MKRTRIPAQEQYRMIQECRQSGLSDYQWCMVSISDDITLPVRAWKSLISELETMAL